MLVLTDVNRYRRICDAVKAEELPWSLSSNYYPGVKYSAVITDIAHSNGVQKIRENGHRDVLAVGIGRANYFTSNVFNGGILNPRWTAEEIRNKIRYINQEKYRIGITFGEIGFGPFTSTLNSIIRYNFSPHTSVGSPHIGGIFLYSNHLSKEGYRSLRTVDWESSGTSLECCNTPEEVFVNSDVVLITTGRKDTTDFSKVNGRRNGRANPELVKNDLRRNLPNVTKAFRAARDVKYPGLFIVMSNPTGEFMQIGRELYGIPYWKMLSAPNDPNRLKHRIAEQLRKIKGLENLDWANEIFAPIIGSHERYIPLLGETTVRGKPLYDIYPLFEDGRFLRDLMRELREYPPILMEQSKQTPYVGTPAFVARVLANIAHGVPTRDSLNIWVPELGTFTGWQAKIEYDRDNPLSVMPDPDYKPKLSLPIRKRLAEVQRDRTRPIEEVLNEQRKN